MSAVLLPCCKSSLLCGSHGMQQQSHIKFVWATTIHNMCVSTLSACLCCVWVRASLCICVLEPHISAFCFFCSVCSCCCCFCCRIMSVSHRPSSSQALDFVADTIQHKCLCSTTYHACVDIYHMRVFRVCYDTYACVGVCRSVHLRAWCWNLTLFAAAAAAVPCRLNHTVPQALKLSTMWQPRYSRSLTASFVWTTSMRVLTLHVYDGCVCCSMIRVKHEACATTVDYCRCILVLL